jgi:hypothetical protein
LWRMEGEKKGAISPSVSVTWCHVSSNLWMQPRIKRWRENILETWHTYESFVCCASWKTVQTICFDIWLNNTTSWH